MKVSINRQNHPDKVACCTTVKIKDGKINLLFSFHRPITYEQVEGALGAALQNTLGPADLPYIPRLVSDALLGVTDPVTL